MMFLGIVPAVIPLMVLHIIQMALACQVIVKEPWPMLLPLPSDSTIEIHCNVTSGSLSWSVDLAFDNPMDYQYRTDVQVDSEELNTYGVYELPRIENAEMTPVLRLFINNTSMNNGTRIICNRGAVETTMFVYDPTSLTNELEIVHIDRKGINISWSQQQTSDFVREVYSLSIVYGSSHDVVPVNDTHYSFRAPDNAPPCQVYNFSVTAIPVGATYTGDGCSVPSPVLSRMLPSLPDIILLESSLNHMLQMRSGFLVKVFFMAANSCEAYPVSGYVLEVEGPTTSSKSIVPGNVISVDNLLENEVYSFHIIVSNVVGNVSTNRTIIYTTDVQKVTATVSAEAITVQCMFVNGSTARGCMVVLVGQSDNTTVTLTREGLCVTGSFNDTHLLQNTYITGVFGYDIESDGTVGTLAIFGELSNDTLTCPSDNSTQAPGPSLSLRVIVPVVVVVVAVIVTATIATLIMSYITLTTHKRKFKISDVSNRKDTVDPPLNTTNAAAPTDVTGADDEDQAMPLYDMPIKAVERTAGDGADRNGNQYNSAMHTPESPERDVNKGPTYAELTEDKDHTYHTLEPPRPPRGIVVPLPGEILPGEILPDEDAPELPPPYRPGSPTPPPPPIYHDLNDLPSKEGVNKQNSDMPVS